MKPHVLVRSVLVMIALIALGVLTLWYIKISLDELGYKWRWERIPQFLVYRNETTGALAPGLLAKGFLMTLRLSLAAIVCSLVFGVIVGVCRIAQEPVLRWTTGIYIELVRGTPLLVQIYGIYFLVGSAFQMTKFVAGVTALTVFTSAYIAEMVRGGIESIDRGQMEAARTLGLSWRQSMMHVIMPQAMRRMIAPLTGQFISLIKDSSLVSVAAVTELTLAGKQIQGTYFLTMEVWITIAVLYLGMTIPLSFLSRYLERRFAYK